MPHLDRLKAKSAELYAHLARLGLRHWLIALAVLVGSVVATPYLDDMLGLQHARWWLFQRLSEATPHLLEPRWTNIVLIGDTEHYNPPLNGESPTNRAYLGTLIANLAARHVPVIALDFDLHLSGSHAKGTRGDYGELDPRIEAQTRALMRAIVVAAEDDHRIVLANTVWYGRTRGYSLMPSAYQLYGICTKVDDDGHWSNPGARDFPISPHAAQNISCGHINFADDMRLLPPRLALDEGGSIDGFSFAIASALRPRMVARIPYSRSYVNFIEPDTMVAQKIIVPAGWIYANDPRARDYLNPGAVIIGAQWRTIDIGRGDFVDSLDTPIGPLTGALVHANYAEAILDSRTYHIFPTWIPRILEILLGILSAVVFSLTPKIPLKLAIFAALIAGLVLVQWLILQLVGMLLESLIPITGLFLHSVLERLFGPHGGHGTVLAANTKGAPADEYDA